MFVDLFEASGLLVSLALFQNLIERRWGDRGGFVAPVVSGLLFGGVALIGMMHPVVMREGLIFDPRSIVVSLSGVFGGPVSAVIAAVIAGGYRVWVGGIGTVPGLGVIGSSALLGVVFGHLLHSGRVRGSLVAYWMFGLTVHAVALLCMFALPLDIALAAIRNIALPFLVVFPVAEAFLGYLLGALSSQLVLERSLEEAQRRFSAILDNTFQFIGLLKADGTVLEANDTALRFAGAERADVVGRKFWMGPWWRHSTAEQEKIKDAVDRARQGEFVRFVSTHADYGGNLHQVDVSMKPVFDALGAVYLIIPEGRDITEEMRATELLKVRSRLSGIAMGGEVDDLLRTGLDEAERLSDSSIGFFHFIEEDQETISLQQWSTNTLDKMCSADAKGQHYPISEAGVWVECVSRREPVIHNDYATVPNRKGMPDGHAEVVRELTLPVIRNGLVVAVIGVGNKAVDYTEADVEMVGQIASMVTDLSKWMKAEAAVKQNLEAAEIVSSVSRLALLDAPLDEIMGRSLDLILAYEGFDRPKTGFIALVDEDGNTLRMVADRNCPDALKETCSTMSMGTCVCGRVAETQQALYCAHDDEHHDISYEGMEPHGHCCLPISAGDKALGVLNIYVADGFEAPPEFRKLLETVADTLAGLIRRKRGDEVLVRTIDELSKANTEIERFSFVAAHDLQEPVRNVITYSQRLRKELAGRLGEAEGEYLSFIVGGATRIRMLVSDLMAYTKVASEGAAFHSLDLNGVLGNAELNLKGIVAETGTEIIVPELPSIRGDANQIMLLFQNLISNAIKFRKEDEAPRIEIAVERRDDDWLFSVSDNGIGLEMQYGDRIFEIFKRLHTIAEYPGSGVGLAVCKRIVERHGGRIWVESAPGQGATFFFTLSAES